MGKPKDPHPRKVEPKERGEKWRLIDRSWVIVLERTGKGFVRCFTEKGFIVIHHKNVFVEKEIPV